MSSRDDTLRPRERAGWPCFLTFLTVLCSALGDVFSVASTVYIGFCALCSFRHLLRVLNLIPCGLGGTTEIVGEQGRGHRELVWFHAGSQVRDVSGLEGGGTMG